MRSAPTLKIWMTPLASVAMLEKLALLKMAFCKAPVLSSVSACRTSVSSSIVSAPFLWAANMDLRLRTDADPLHSLGAIRRGRTRRRGTREQERHRVRHPRQDAKAPHLSQEARNQALASCLCR